MCNCAKNRHNASHTSMGVGGFSSIIFVAVEFIVTSPQTGEDSVIYVELSAHAQGSMRNSEPLIIIIRMRNIVADKHNCCTNLCTY